MPGASGSGKSTLVEALVAAGATRLSDEFAVLDRQGRIHSYRRPNEPAALDGSREPVPVGFVGVLRYRAGARWSPKRLPSGRLVLETLAHTVPARSHPERALDTLVAAFHNAAGFKAWRSEAKLVAPRLLDLLRESALKRIVEP